jgi:hypothetical protein
MPFHACAASVPSVLVDTDIGPDCDDAGALAVLHALADRGGVEILGVMYALSNPYGAPCVDAINTYYGRADIPVGTLKDDDLLKNTTAFNQFIAEVCELSISCNPRRPTRSGYQSCSIGSFATESAVTHDRTCATPPSELAQPHPER